MATLQTYLTATQRLLHDANANFWSTGQLTDYINAARDRVVADTGCNRQLLSMSTVASQESYAFPAPSPGKAVIDILNITLLWGTQRVPLNYYPFTRFNVELRPWQTFVSRPVAFTVYGQSSFRLGPVPDQIYTMELDCVCTAVDLVAATDVDVLIFPFTEPVPYYAAYLAKEYEQSYEEAERHQKAYQQKIFTAQRSSFTRRIVSPYGGV